MKKQEVKVKVVFTDGYQQRYTAACLEQLRRRGKKGGRIEKRIQPTISEYPQ